MERMKEIVEKLNLYAYQYYVLDEPIVSDKEYDKLYDELVLLEKQTGIVLPSSPTIRVGGDILPKFKKFEHTNKLYSLDKAQSKLNLKKWYDAIIKAFPKATFSLSYKFDGLTIVCEYKNGVLIKAGTRGNGSVGEDVTEQAKTIKTVPLTIKYKGHVIVQGEGIMPLSNLAKYNKTANEKLKNARNAVAGGIRNLDPKETAKRMLDWYCYNVTYIDNDILKSQNDIENFLTENGFKISPFFEICSSYEDITEKIDKIDKIKSKLNFLIDGVVINVNNFLIRDELGFTTKFPKWALAFKFEALEVSTILKNVVWQVGRTGKITPIGLLEPVELAGATVQRATLNNIDDIRKKKLEIGSRVFVRRSNEVIPEILGLADKLPNSKEIIPPIHCPSCGATLESKNMNLYCRNYGDCYDQIIERLTHFCVKEAMNIEGLSSQTIKQIYDNLNIRYLHDLYSLTKEQLLTLEGFKNKKAENILSSLEKSKNAKFANFLFALGILNVGVKTAKDLAKHFDSLEELTNSSLETLTNIKDIGEITAKSIKEFFDDEHNIYEISNLFRLGIKIEYSKLAKNSNSIFYGKTVVLTGSFENLTRLQATSLLEQNGATVTSSVSKNTDYVIFGLEAGSKLDKAKALNIKTLSEKEVFGKLI